MWYAHTYITRIHAIHTAIITFQRWRLVDQTRHPWYDSERNMNKASFNSIDLHIHTTISDGTDTPEILLDNVKRYGIDLFSVSDHDAIKGSLLMPELLCEGDPAFIRGVEFSSRDQHGKYHILGYGYDPQLPGIQELVNKGHSFRMEKTRARITYLQETFDMVFPEEEIEQLLALDNPGKPHIAKMMIRHGYADNIADAIDRYIDGKKFPNKYLEPEEVIKGILASNGIPVLAHPSYGSGDELILGDEMDERLQRLMGYGLAGVEAFYSGFTDRIRNQVLDFAKKYDLYVTAGSDYHGTNKLVELGDNDLNDLSQAPEGLFRFLEDVPIIRGGGGTQNAPEQAPPVE